MHAYDATFESLLNPSWMPTVLDANSLAARPFEAVAVECARLAYCKFESDAVKQAEWRAALALLGAIDPVYFTVPETGSQGYAFVLPGAPRAIVAFRGTEPTSIKDLLVDLDFPLVDWNPRQQFQAGRVHEGFAKAFQSLVDNTQLKTWLGNHAGCELVLTGHSLGAALATLGASYWGAKQLVTMGSPRVGDAAFAATLRNTRMQRYVNCCDAVTEAPLAIGGYVHVDQGIYIDADGGLPGILPANATDRGAARINYYLSHFLQPDTVPSRDFADHAPINYLRAWF